MTDKNFIRYFVILAPHESVKDHITANGYCKVEAMDGKAVVTVSLRDLKQDLSPTQIYAIIRGCPDAILIGTAQANGDCTVYKEFRTTASNAFNSNSSVSLIDAIYVVADGKAILCGYTDRNSSSSSKKAWDECLLSSITSKEDESPDVHALDVEDSVEGSFSEDSASPIALSEATETEDSDASDGLASYISTFAKLYQGLVDTNAELSNANNKNEDNCDKDNDDSYFSHTGEYYRSKLEGEEVHPFAFEQHNTKWVKLQNNAFGTLLGCVYESDKPKYIAYASPSIGISLGAPQTCRCTVWLPASDNACSILGYWVTFIDCNSGEPVTPDIKIL